MPNKESVSEENIADEGLLGDIPIKYGSSKTISFKLENDFFVGSNDGYTNGAGINFGTGPYAECSNNNLYDWYHWLTNDLYISTK